MKFLSGDQWLGGRSLHTTRSVAQIFLGVVFDVSSHWYGLCCGSNCMQANNSEAGEWVPCVTDVDGACYI